MSHQSIVVAQNNATQKPSIADLPKQSMYWEVDGYNPDNVKKEAFALNLHMKNRKKFAHLYELEKYFR